MCKRIHGILVSLIHDNDQKWFIVYIYIYIHSLYIIVWWHTGLAFSHQGNSKSCVPNCMAVPVPKGRSRGKWQCHDPSGTANTGLAAGPTWTAGTLTCQLHLPNTARARQSPARWWTLSVGSSTSTAQETVLTEKKKKTRLFVGPKAREIENHHEISPFKLQAFGLGAS